MSIPLLADFHPHGEVAKRYRVYRESDGFSERELRWLTGGYAYHPTVVINGEVLVEPSLRELEWILQRLPVG